MPTKTTGGTNALNASTKDILNAMRNGASADYKALVPIATEAPSSVKEIGAIITGNPTLKNEFISTLVNRIGKVIIDSKMYENPWEMFKRGLLEYGESIEQIFVDLANPFEYDPAIAEKEVFKREFPDVQSAFHILNYQKFYKVTIQDQDLEMAFVSADGVKDLIARIVQSLYTGARYDEFVTMKYLIAKQLLSGDMYKVNITAINTSATGSSTLTNAVKEFKSLSNKLEFMSNDYNMAHVKTYTPKEDQYLIISADLDASLDVNVLASAFNMDKVQFMGHKVLVDGFGTFDVERLNDLFKDSPDYETISDEDLDYLNKNVVALVVDKDWFMIFDKLSKFTEQYNGQGLYWNYWYHQWKLFSVSPFHNAIVFTQEDLAGSMTTATLTLDPTEVSAKPGASIVINAKVTGGSPLDSKKVIWKLDKDSEGKATVDYSGLVHISQSAVPGDTINVIADLPSAELKALPVCTITVI